MPATAPMPAWRRRERHRRRDVASSGSIGSVMPIRVALADDSVFVLEGMQQLLAAHQSIEVVAACDDMPSLLRAVEVHQPDVVVSDIRMPPSNTDEGIQLAVRLRQLNPEIGVVILSQYAEPRYVLKLLETGSEGAHICSRSTCVTPRSSWPPSSPSLQVDRSSIRQSSTCS